MTRKYIYLLYILIITLVACESAVPEETPITTSLPATSASQAESTSTHPAISTVTAASVETSESSDLSIPEAFAETAVPAPTLFDVTWDDRQVFRPGLIESEQGVLAQLPGASVYHFDLQIEDNTSIVQGRGEIRYTNEENVSLNEVYFHLFPNLLGGSIDIANLSVNGQAIVPESASTDNSAMRILLSDPLEPGEAVVFQMDFITEVPQLAERNYGIFANTDGVLALAHFYPLIAVYDDEGWNIEPPPEIGDVTYADSSFYLVRVTASPSQVIAGSGVEITHTDTEDAQTITLAAGPVRDFYLAISDYVVVSRSVGQTKINSYAPAELSEGAEAALTYAIDAVKAFNNRFGTYPFTELDIVSTPTLALGIEYPGIIALTQRIYGLDENGTSGLPNQVLLESTTAHEVGHQWFYSLIGNDQVDEPWLDESLTQYATWLYFVDMYGTAAAEGFYQSLEGRWDRVGGANIPIGLPVAAYDGAEYSAIVYGRGPIFVRELAQTMGEETFTGFLLDYSNTNRWGIVTTADFKQLAEQHCACDLTSLFAQWVYPQN